MARDFPIRTDDTVAKPEAAGPAGLAVALWLLGRDHPPVALDDGGRAALGDLAGDARALAETLALLSRARTLGTRARRLDPALDPVWETRARDLLNAPKVWAAVNAVAGALQARRVLSAAEVAVIADWVTEARPPLPVWMKLPGA